MTGPPLAVRTFAGQPEHSAQVRAWYGVAPGADRRCALGC